MQTKVVSKPYSFVGKDGKKIEGENFYLVLETPLGSFSFKIDVKGNDKQILKNLLKQ